MRPDRIISKPVVDFSWHPRLVKIHAPLQTTPTGDHPMAFVNHFGAAGDGQRDDTEALEHALTAGDGVLELAKGSYRITRPIVIATTRTGYAAVRFGLKDRGILREGAWADLLVFDPETIGERADFDDPYRYPEGIDTVLVNGELAVAEGQLQNALAGSILRGRGSHSAAPHW